MAVCPSACLAELASMQLQRRQCLSPLDPSTAFRLSRLAVSPFHSPITHPYVPSFIRLFLRLVYQEPTLTPSSTLSLPRALYQLASNTLYGERINLVAQPFFTYSVRHVFVFNIICEENSSSNVISFIFIHSSSSREETPHEPSRLPLCLDVSRGARTGDRSDDGRACKCTEQRRNRSAHDK